MYSLYRWRWPLPATEPTKTTPNAASKAANRAANRAANNAQHTALHCISVVLLTLAISSLANGAYIHAKATLAQWLIANAWQQAQSQRHAQHQRRAIKPWPWADTWPVARLQYAHGKQDLYILAGAQGNSLAFGPGHQFGSALPGTTGVSIVGGHRDTHFAFLQHLQTGDKLQVTTANGTQSHYTVTATHIADSLTEPLLAMPYASQLLLVTCYPFNAATNGSLRYVVTAELQTNTHQSNTQQQYKNQESYL